MKAATVSHRERRFLTVQYAWALAMSGDYGSAPAVRAKLSEELSFVELDGESLVHKLDEVCRRSAELKMHPPASPVAADRDAEGVRDRLTHEHRAYWLRDRDTFAGLHLNEAQFRMMSWIESGGMTYRRNWQDFANSWDGDLAKFPLPNLYLAYLARRSNEALTVHDDVAWATFDTIYPTSDLPEINSSSVTHSMRLFERRNGQWLISYRVDLDDQFGQNITPIWQTDSTGRVLSMNAAANALANTARGGASTGAAVSRPTRRRMAGCRRSPCTADTRASRVSAPW